MDDVSADITENGVDVITLTSKVDDGDTTQNSFMLNAYYDFDTDSSLYRMSVEELDILKSIFRVIP